MSDSHPVTSRVAAAPAGGWRRPAGIAVRVTLVAAALWALRRQLAGVDLGDLVRQLRAYGLPHLGLAVACAAASFLVLGVVELLALRRVTSVGAAAVPRRAALTTAFVANALSQSVGLALLTGAAVRARSYARHGLDAVAIARVTAFVTLTATLGLLAAGGAALVHGSGPLHVGMAGLAARPLGALLLAIVGVYVAWSASGRGDAVGRGRWVLARPTPALAAGQLGLSALDWLLTAGVLYAFVPPSLAIGFWPLAGAYMIAQTAAVTSHVPAGAGVLEAAVLGLTVGGGAPRDRASVVASLLMFRVIYYLLPLCAAILVLGVAELRRRRVPVTRVANASVPAVGVRRVG